MTPQELKDIEARANAATPGPWRCGNGDEGWFWGFLVADTVVDGCPDDKPSPAVLADFNRHVRYDANIAFCARARSDIPNLLAYIATLTERLRAVEAERDTARKAHAETMSWLVKTGIALGWKLGGDLTKLYEVASALCAELQRKDAALTMAREERVEAAKRLSKQAARWLDDFIADSELIDAINGELAAAHEKLENDDGK